MKPGQKVQLAANAQVRTTPAWALGLHRSQVPEEAMAIVPHPQVGNIGLVVSVSTDNKTAHVRWPDRSITVELVSQLYQVQGGMMVKGDRVKLKDNARRLFGLVQGQPPRRTDTGTIIAITGNIADVHWENGDVTTEMISQLSPV